MAPWSLKTVAKRLMGEEEQRVVPVNERRKRTSQTNLLETMGPEAPADLLRKLRGQKLSQKALDGKLLEVIIKLDALGARGEDVVGWESHIEGMDLDHERRSVLAERAPPARDMATSPTAPAPIVRPPSRIAKRKPFSIAIGAINSTEIVTLSPGITISVPSLRVTTPVTSVVRK